MIKTLKNIKFLALFILSDLIILAMIVYAMTMNNTINDVYAPLADAAKTAKYELALAQRSIENISRHKPNAASIQQSRKHLRNAMVYVTKIGVDTPHSPVQQHTKLALQDIVLLKTWMQAQPSQSKAIMMPTAQTTAAFNKALEHITQAEQILSKLLNKERQQQKSIYQLILLSTAMLLLLVSIHYRRAKKREHAYIQALKKTASTDALTGLNNRRCFDEDIKEAWDHACRGGYTISVALCDIDYFKKYNDSLGHQAGDVCLQRVASIMQATLRRPVDKVARYGGEEFIFLLPFTNRLGAAKLMSKLHSNLKHAAITHPASTCASHISLSIGIFTMSADAITSADTAVNNADQALYQAKSHGRNQTCHHG